jgi:hypothetical protein
MTVVPATPTPTLVREVLGPPAGGGSTLLGDERADWAFLAALLGIGTGLMVLGLRRIRREA